MTANRLLGYPDDARLLIINADDYGMCHGSNAATIDAWKHGVVASTTLMVPCPWAQHAMQLLQENPDLPFGVHLTLVCDFHIYRWGPVSLRSEVPSIVDERGGFYHGDRIPELLERAEIGEVEREFRAQIDTVLDAGLRPTHLDWHCIADGEREDIFELTLRLAREYGLALRTHFPHHADACRSMGLPSNDHEVLDSYTVDPETKQEHYARLLRDLPPGLSEWAFHPSLGNDETRTLEPTSWQVRRSDYDFAISPEARDIIKDEGIILLDYRALQEAWSASHA